MNLSTLQTELVACALCEADGKNPDETLPAGEWDVVPVGPGGGARSVVGRKAWQSYEGEARRLVLAAETLAKFSLSLSMFRTLARIPEDAGRA